MEKVKWKAKRLLSLVLSVIMITGIVNVSPVAAKEINTNTVADWKFGQNGVKSGTIENGDLVIADQSGHNNDLKMQLYKGKQLTSDSGDADWTKYLSFDQKAMNSDSDGSMNFNGSNAEGTGADFITVDNAAINGNTFENGYTMEFLYYFPQDWTTSDQWMGLMARQVENTSNVNSMAEPQLGSMSIAVSNCKEIQFLTAPANDNEKMSSAAWSVSMDKGGVWYHVAITSDGSVIRTYINGCEAFRDYASEGMDGMFADTNDGRFRVGSSWWKEGSDTLDKFLKGNLQEIRISDTALDKSQWLISDPEQYIGEYGNNNSYTLEDENNYNFVFLPDTQNTVKFKPAVMDKAIDELIGTADQTNVAAVVSLGDIVENNNDGTQYNNARDIFYQMPEQGIKFLAQKGNHDGWSSGISNYYNSFSKYSTLFMNRTASYLTNNSPSGDSSYMLVSAGSYNYLVISLSSSGSASGKNNNTSWDSRDEAWFRDVLNAYPNTPAIVTTHDLQNCSETTPNAIKLSSQGQKLWDIVKNYDQVFLMVGGHSHGSGVETLTNVNGKPVISILADYQFSYNGGNGFFKYCEFDESKNKIFLKTYSPYAASLSAGEKTFFDVNFLTGEGNYNEVELNFKDRFAGMEIVKEVNSEGKWMSGEYHAHTNQSNDAQVASSKVENILDVAFRENGYTGIEGAGNITQGGFDYFFTADHLRKSISDENGNSITNKPRYIGIEQQIKKYEQLKAKGKYMGKVFFTGFEWDMPGLDHASVGIIDSNSNRVPTSGIHEFEWLFADQNNDPDSLYEDNGSKEKQMYGERKATSSGSKRSDVQVAYEGVEWLKNNYPNSYALINHPSRHNGGSGVVTARNMRTMNDIAPNIVFGFEGMPGNQLSPDGNRSEMKDIYGGADIMLAKVGGIWDSMLSEGRHFYNFANSDFHFKISGSYSSGYYPSEYSSNYTFVTPGDDSTFDHRDVVEGLRSGNSFAVYGNLINALEFKADNLKNTAVMGSDLQAATDDKVTLTIRFKSPVANNYAQITPHSTTASNEVSVDHVDLIGGEITGKLVESEYDNTENTTTAVVKTFTREDWGEADADGYYTISYEVTADANRYYRLRGTNLEAGTAGFLDEQGNPLMDTAYTPSSVPDFDTRVNQLNDRNYTGLWFYSNPIFIYTTDSNDASLENISISEGTLSPAFDSTINAYTAVVPYTVSSLTVTPFSANSHSTVKINGIQVVTGSAIELNVGTNDINIEVTAQDGITTSEYVVTVTRSDADALIITGPTSLTLPEGYLAVSTGSYTVSGAGIVTVTKSSGDDRISWNDVTKKLDILEGIGPGTYPVVLTAANGLQTDYSIQFVLTVLEEGKEAKVIAVGRQSKEVMAGNQEEISFPVTTVSIKDDTPVSVSWCDVSGNAVNTPAGLTVSAVPVVASGSSIIVNMDTSALAGTYYFKAASDGVTSEISVLTIREPKGRYTVTFMDWDGRMIYTQTVQEGQGAIAPANPARSGYTFIGWDKDFQHVTGNLTIWARYEKNITWEDNTPQNLVTPDTYVKNISTAVKQGDSENNLIQITIIRTKKEDGTIQDLVNFQKENAQTAVNSLKEKNENTARIVIPDDKDEVSKTDIKLASDAINILAKGKLNLQFVTKKAGLSLTADTLQDISETNKEDIYFHVMPVTDKNQKDALLKGAQKVAGSIKSSVKESTAVMGNPVTVETNMPSLEADLTLPLTGVEIPKSAIEREDLFKKLAVYIKHSDGEEELVPGTIQKNDNGIYEISFHINKFSSFTLVKTDVFIKSSECKVTKVITPSKAVIKGKTITAKVQNKASVTIKVSVNKQAFWKLYSDKACKKVIARNKMKLKKGVNKAYIKVTYKAGKAKKIYSLKIIRKDTVKTKK